MTTDGAQGSAGNVLYVSVERYSARGPSVVGIWRQLPVALHSTSDFDVLSRVMRCYVGTRGDTSTTIAASS